MHELLRELRISAPIRVTSAQDRGRFMYVGLGYEGVGAGLLLRKRAPLAPGDVALVHDGPATQIPGSTAAERVRNIVSWFEDQHAKTT